ncbi:hypothetical protein [Azospirillum ramasamyi]|uniref:hypothetical protein n=1 Tax=Azospirillum ramasamyi TaxID=682998 RepID=UPI0013A69427|nr:hypothetical protein [Azospirillum ramasamyi]
MALLTVLEIRKRIHAERFPQNPAPQARDKRMAAAVVIETGALCGALCCTAT